MSQHRSSRFLRALRRTVAAGFLMTIVAWAGWTFVLTSESSRELGADALKLFDAINPDPDGRASSVEVTLAVEAVEGLPRELLDRSVRLRYAAPERLAISSDANDFRLSAGKNGDEAWVYLPDKDFGVIGSPAEPLFKGGPEFIEAASLPSLKPPLSRLQVRLLPALLRVEKGAIDAGDGTAAPGLAISQSALAERFLDLPDFRIEAVFAGEEKDLPSWVRLTLPDRNVSMAVALDDPAIRAAGEGPGWEIPADSDDTVETVALALLTRCARIVARQKGAYTPPLPPETGARSVAAASGKGRLENHDGVRVLFMRGTPGEMGRQQGELMRDEIHAVVERLVYGVGVGSSFGKGRWFFGEIEEAQARLEPFVPESHLEEMDALADASGLTRQEVRLANFFPELFHCSGFALQGKATRGGEIYHGRILDYIRGAGLEDNAVVMVYQPDEGNAWVNVSYAGFIGSVTAMNEKQIAIGEMGGRGEGNWDGKPMAQLVREVMEQCDTIDDAVELMRAGPRTCEYYYVISDAKSGRAVGIKATPEIFETVWPGESHPQLPHPVEDTVLMSSGDRYEELVRRVREGYGEFDAETARALMTRPVCMTSNIQSVLFAPGTLDFWVANADSENVASHTRYTRFNLNELIAAPKAMVMGR